MQELNFPELTVEGIKLKITTIRTRYAAELAKVIKSEKSSAGLHDIFVPKLFWFTNEHIHFCVAFVFHEPQCQQRLFLR